jgi:hypothetical protein
VLKRLRLGPATKAELKLAIETTDDHAPQRLWQWLLDEGFAVPGPTVTSRNLKTLVISPAWTHPLATEWVKS